MEKSIAEIKIRGRSVKVPAVSIDQKTVIITGRWIKMASVLDEEWLAGQGVEDPERVIRRLKDHDIGADIFTFSQKLPETKPKYDYHWEQDNVAAIPVTVFDDWWEKRLPQVTRKNIRRAAKRGVTARVVGFNDELVRGIIEIHNDTPTRQGAPFAHYGKDFDVVKKEYGTYLDSSEWIGAYFENELIGIIKLIHMGQIASIMQIVTKTEHYDKRPTNVLIAKAVEVCAQKGIPYLVYGKYIYGNKTNSSLTEFKRRNGFEGIGYPRYFVPLTPKGKIFVKLRLHLGLLGILPSGVISVLRGLRSCYYHWVLIPLGSPRKLQVGSGNAGLGDKED